MDGGEGECWADLAGVISKALICGCHSAYSVEGIFPLELTWFLIPFSQNLSDESINRGLVCAHMPSIARTQKILTFMS